MRKVIAASWEVSAIVILALIGGALAIAKNDDRNRSQALTVHEWGTFTTVAGLDGQALEWLPLSGPNDLPCFVDHFNSSFAKWSPVGAVLNYREARSRLKGTVRMETPVLYFYSPREESLNVKVNFPQGFVSEWYPTANVAVGGTTIAWNNLKVLTQGKTRFPTEASPSHYYKARETDANPVQVAGNDEKFLFYRGLGYFNVPISARVTPSGKFLIGNTKREPMPAIVLFENRGGKIGYRVQAQFEGETTIDPPTLDRDFGSLQKELEKTLISAGLFPKEARAMIETWSDSWFEEGTRVFYILQSKTVDRILPLTIEPAPAHIARAFVGRMEVITPAMVEEVENAISAGDTVSLAKYGRFLGSIVDRMSPRPEHAQVLLDAAYKKVLSELSSACK